MATHLTPEQLARAVSLQRRLWTQERIAEDVGVSQSTVSRALARHNRRMLKRLEKRTASTKAQQIAQLEYVAQEAMDAWDRSKRDVETVKTVEGRTALGSIDKTETTLKGQAGNTAYLTAAATALANIREILGLGAAHDLAVKKLEAILKETGVPTVKDVLKTAEERDAAYDSHGDAADPPAA